ncbi:hypothetical protein TIFTF001_017287 [Ficus carica]|uniref:Uncharacterized protein n=1 Tax=Ficus carica TaxID=3494 RepID=A0AA88A7S7_FICCA|nr:hypothetical protein TIFTF001_017287 [Ficus carica]
MWFLDLNSSSGSDAEEYVAEEEGLDESGDGTSFELVLINGQLDFLRFELVYNPWHMLNLL